MKKSTILKRLLSAITIMVLVSNSGLIPEKIYASSKSQEILDSESDGSESKSVNKDNSENDNRVLDCKYTVHKHGKECYDAEGNIICGYADYVVHAHDKNCYDSAGKLVCKFPVIEEHTHSEECYGDMEKENLEKEIDKENVDMGNEGAIDEGIGQDDMGDTVIIMEEPIPLREDNLTCQKEEIQLHTHTMLCLDENGKLACGKLEVASHQHTDACFNTVRTTTKEVKPTNTLKQQAVSQTIKNTVPEDTTTLQVTQYPEPEADKVSAGLGKIEIIILILAACIICGCIIYSRKKKRV